MARPVRGASSQTSSSASGRAKRAPKSVTKRATPTKIKSVATKKRSFARSVPRAAKRHAGATAVSDTPMRVHVTGMKLEPMEKQMMRMRLGRRLKRFAPHIERLAVRFKDINGPRGGVDTMCRIHLVMSGIEDLFVEARARDAMVALENASRSAKSALDRAMGRAGPGAARRARVQGVRARVAEERALARVRTERKERVARPEAGSLIGRRVGRSRANLLAAAERPEKVRRDAIVDTSMPGVSATDRKAGGGSTAARNTRLRSRKAASTLEDSAKERPSRKSTRKSANRQKPSGKLERAKKRAKHSPSSRARRSAANRA